MRKGDQHAVASARAGNAILFGALYTAVMLLAIRGAWRFYILYGEIEIILTALIVWYAWTWPKQPATT